MVDPQRKTLVDTDGVKLHQGMTPYSPWLHIGWPCPTVIWAEEPPQHGDTAISRARYSTVAEDCSSQSSKTSNYRMLRQRPAL